MNKVIVIAGPTATGKTALSVALSKELGGEVVSADSVQIYKGLNIGSAKPTKEEMQGVPHHMMDILEPDDSFSVANPSRSISSANCLGFSLSVSM